MEMWRSIFKIIRKELAEYFYFLVFWCPGKAGQAFRVGWCKLNFKAFGSGSRFGMNCIIQSADNIEFGKNCSVGRSSCFFSDGGQITISDDVKFNECVHINASIGGKISIGEKCLIGPNVIMRTANHRYLDANKPIFDQGHVVKDIVIKSDVWIAANAVILSGVTIEEGCVIGAGSVVSRSTEPFGIYAGVPSKRIKNRGKR